MTQFDDITSPAHYVADRVYEPRLVIEDWDLNFYLGNALKYISRAGRKNNAAEDLRKAKQYIDFELERLELVKISDMVDGDAATPFWDGTHVCKCKHK